MSIHDLPNTRMHWTDGFEDKHIVSALTVNKFEEIKRFLHFHDNNIDSNDKISKIRPVVESLRHQFLSIPMEEHLSIDEQIIPFKGRSSLKRYNAAKPHKWGYKAYVMCGASGFAYDLEIDVGKDNNLLSDEERDCGASGNVVIRLSRNVPEQVNYRLYFDNYFNSPDLQIYLATKGIWCIGTVRQNRIPNLTLKSDVELKKAGRGSYDEKVATVDGVTVSAIKWQDNKCVTFLTTFASTQPVSTVQRWDPKTSTYKAVACPDVVHVYNKHMGGVDLLDSLIGLYRTTIRSKKWYQRIWFNFMDLTCVNAWLLYRRTFHLVDRPGTSTSKHMKLLDFKIKVARSLLDRGEFFAAV